MSLQDLQTTMRELSTNSNDGKMVQQFIDQEIAVLEEKVSILEENRED